MKETLQRLRIGEVARQTGLTVETLRYYERLELLPASPRSAGGFRHYAPDVVARVRFIKRAQALGVSLDEIGSLTSNRSGDTCGSVREMLTRHIAAIDQQMKELHELRSTLSNYRHRCEAALEEQSNAPCPTLVDLERSQA